MSDKDALSALAQAAVKLQRIEKNRAFDPWTPNSRATPVQQEFLDDIQDITFRYLIGGNQSGKSQTGAREFAWIFAGCHPNFERPERWGKEPIQMIIMGRTMKQVEETLWRKVKGFLEPGTFKETKVGNALSKATHLPTGNTVLFMSHHGIDEASDKAQSFEIHYAWIDEMPKKYRIIEEIHRRIQAKQGRFIATFTPKVINQEIRKLVDSSKRPYSESYKIKMFDNPIYTDSDKLGIIDSLKTATDSYRNTVLNGEWMSPEDSVYSITEGMIEAPQGYSPLWRHVESIDPATNTAGLTIWAEDPTTGVWYCILAEYLNDMFDPNDLYAKCQELTKPYNIVRRVCDPAATPHMGIASGKKCKPPYVYPYAKNQGRKMELIKQLQEKLGSKLRLSPVLADKLLQELDECRWSETSDTPRIVHASKFHLIDSAQYFADLVPVFAGMPQEAKPWYQLLREENSKRIVAEATKKENTSRKWKVVNPKTVFGKRSRSW